jgi:proliferating cell nuclear antigen PCNA
MEETPVTPTPVKKVVRRKIPAATPPVSDAVSQEVPPAPVKKPRATKVKKQPVMLESDSVIENTRITEPEPEPEVPVKKVTRMKKTKTQGTGSSTPVIRRTPKKMITVKTVYKMTVQEDKTKFLMGILKMTAEHVGEGNLHIRSNGIYFQGMDSSHVSMLEFNLHQSWFSEFESLTETRVIGIPFKILSNVLSCYSKADSISLYGAESTVDEKLSVSIREKDNIHHFEIPLMSIDMDLMEIPEQEHTLKIHIPIENIKSSCDRLEKLEIEAPELIYEITPGNLEEDTVTEAVLSMKGSSSSGLKVNIVMTSLTPDMEDYRVLDEPLKTCIALRFMKSYLNQSSIFKTGIIEISEGLPVILTTKLDDIPELNVETTEGTVEPIVYSGAGEPTFHDDFTEKNIVRIFIAPRVDDDS